MLNRLPQDCAILYTPFHACAQDFILIIYNIMLHVRYSEYSVIRSH